MAKTRWDTSGGVVWNRHNNTLLLVKTKKEGWTWPKGKVDPGETVEQAGEREVSEESGVIVKMFRRLGRINSKHANRHYFLYIPLRDTHQPDHEVSKIKWVDPQQARTMLRRNRDKKVLNMAVEEIASL